MRNNSNIDNPNVNVKQKNKKINPVYDRPPPPEEDTSTFEYVVRHTGQPGSETNIDTIPITTHSCPGKLKMALWYLRTRHENLGTQSKVARLLCRCGIGDLEIPEIRLLRKRGEEIFEVGSETDQEEFMDNSYRISKKLGIKSYRLTIPVDDQVAARISNVASDLGISQSKAIVLCLCFGMRRSQQWITEKYRKWAEEETEKFKKWVRERVEK